MLDSGDEAGRLKVSGWSPKAEVLKARRQAKITVVGTSKLKSPYSWGDVPVPARLEAGLDRYLHERTDDPQRLLMSTVGISVECAYD